jgi:hypothetical protein
MKGGDTEGPMAVAGFKGHPECRWVWMSGWVGGRVGRQAGRLPQAVARAP